MLGRISLAEETAIGSDRVVDGGRKPILRGQPIIWSKNAKSM
jgi:hypothetical protein